jgi:hypothetical protein
MFVAPAYSFARPNDATPYAANDLIANSTTAGQVVPMQFNLEKISNRGKIVAVRLFTDNEVVVNANFNLHLFRELPVPGVGDNAPFAVGSARPHLGAVACDMTAGSFVTATDKAKRFALTVPIVFEAPFEQRVIYGLLQAAAIYTPAALEVFEATLEIEG